MRVRFFQKLRAASVALLIAAAPVAAADLQSFGAALVRAEAHMTTGALDSAVAAGKQAFAAAPTPALKVRAARLVAAAHFRAKQYFRAELWLRRAWQAAPDDPTRRAVGQDFAGLRAVNPLTVRIDFSAAPNSNINNGSQAETVTIWGLPFLLNPDARALAGFEVAASVQLAYQLQSTPKSQTQIGLNIDARSYALSPASARAAPDVSGSDYAYAGVGVFAQHRWTSPALPGPTTLNASFGKTYYSGDPYTHYARISLAQDLTVSNTTSANISFGIDRQVNDASSGAISTIALLSVQTASRLANGDRLNLSLATDKTIARDVLTENRAVRASIGYSLAKPIWNTNVSVDLGLENRRWDVSIYDLTGRRDTTLTAGVAVAIPQATVYGFTPVVRAEARKTHSNIDLFDRLSYGLRLGLQTQF